MIDTARLFRPVRQLEQIIDAMSWGNFNVFPLHFTDKGAWPVELLRYPNLTAVYRISEGAGTSANPQRKLAVQPVFR
jgi:N-acetyl-beta-hexosaminidase